MATKKSTKWLKKKRLKFLAKIADSPNDGLYNLIISEEIDENNLESVATKYLLVANFGLLNGMSSNDIMALTNTTPTMVDVFLPLDRPFAIVNFKDKTDAIRCFSAVSENKCSAVETFAFFLSRLPEFETADEIDFTDHRPIGVRFINDFLTENEEKRLLDFVDELKKERPSDSSLKQRKAWHFGYTFDYARNQVSFVNSSGPLPAFCKDLLFKRLFGDNLLSEEPDQLTINEYDAGDGIPYHVESSCFGEEVVSISLGSPIVMDLRQSMSTNCEEQPHVSILLENRSLLILTQEARHKWEHGILSRKSEVIVENKQNKEKITFFKVPKSKRDSSLLIPSQNNLTFGTLLRKKRISFTFRKVKHLPSSNIKLPSRNNEINSGDLADLEKTFVREVYENVAPEFSSTRHTPWPQVAEFVRSLPEGSLLADVGCGNGRYFCVNDGIFITGGDSCENLLKLAQQTTPRCSVLQSDCCNLPFVSNTFDAVICIAVIHHLASEARRALAVNEIYRILRPNGGRALIYVWAVEQSDKLTGLSSTYTANNNKSSQLPSVENVVNVNGHSLPVHTPRTPFNANRPDCFVPWKKNALRYYHVFQIGELEKLFVNLNDNVTFKRQYFDEGNWCVEFVKN